MTYIDTQYFSLNRILLLSIGLWPYQQTKLTCLQLTIYFVILTSFIVFQLAKFMTAKCTIDLVIKIFSLSLFFVMLVIKYNSFWVNLETVKCLLEQFERICNELKDENEIAIIKKYAFYGKRYTARIILFTTFSVSTLICLPIWSYILDTVQYTNKSHTRHTINSLINYFINQEKYFYFIVLHVYTAICIGALVVIATGTMLIVYLKYSCGMFRIASYRIEQAMTFDILQKSQENANIIKLIHKNVIYAIDIHRKAMEFAEYMITNFEGSFFALITISVCCLSLNLFEIFQTMSIEDADKFLLHLVIIVIIILYMFLANYAGQEITDHNNHVFSTAYSVRWYAAPLHIQKLILFLLQRGSKTFSLNVGGLFVASLKCFASLTSTSMSYFTVMYSTQQ